VDLWRSYFPYGITTVDELDLIDEPWISKIVNHHGKRILLWLLKMNKTYLTVGALSIVLFFIRLCTRLRNPRRRKVVSKPKKE
jgi:cytochrome b561